MTRWLRYPFISLAVAALWLLMNQSAAPGHILLGILLGLAGGGLLATLELPEGILRRPLAALRLTIAVVTDVARSNIAVARIVLGARPVQPGFMTLPLEIRSPYALAALAVIITATPGTLWVAFDDRAGELTIHVLDLVDKTVWVETIKQRYECHLMEIFE
ncbi:MAG: Na+/H+ antiporter subunit E [Sphingomonadales bacterium]